ncbi:hypothetical protein [Streptosporangium saharense]|uniref:hypothetical protein n=1 Tax=Streptosporangium saharense TaxID=1706840 RepID=UPI003F4DE85F
MSGQIRLEFAAGDGAQTHLVGAAQVRIARDDDDPTAWVGTAAVMEAVRFVASLDATAGSLIANAERISPPSSGTSRRAHCSGERPVTSARPAWSRTDSPCSSGRNRFHRPCERASARCGGPARRTAVRHHGIGQIGEVLLRLRAGREVHDGRFRTPSPVLRTGRT